MDSPYKFLDFYGIDDQSMFFGREREINILVADVAVNRLVVLFARTGTGKTSLINAGVRPRLEARDFRTFYVRVEQDPTEAARDVLRKENLLEKTTEETSLSTQLSSIVESLNKPIVLFFDQFEEFFIQIRDRETRREFISDISEVYRNVESGVHLVFSMREEYFHEMDEFRSEIPSIFHKNSNLRLLPLDADQARRAIVGPAEAEGVEVEPSLSETIIRDLMQERSIRPTSLQIVCDTLWRNKSRASGDRIALDEYEQLGGWRRILDQRLEKDIEEALVDINLLALMHRLIPELRTERNTKYPRLISDLVKTLNSDQVLLSELVARLKAQYIIREITISGANAIEWASDYLAEQTSDLLRLIKKIELRRLLAEAVDTSKEMRAATLEKGRKAHDLTEEEIAALYLPKETFTELSQNIQYLELLDLDETVVFLFDAALYHQQYLMLWFEQISQTQFEPDEILRQKMHDNETLIELGIGAVRLLAELGTDKAIALLSEALDQPDLALEAIDLLVDITGNQATELLANALKRDDLWGNALQSLTRSGTTRSITLLEPFLQNKAKSFQVLETLDQLTKSTRRQTSNMAEKALIRAVAYFLPQLQQKDQSVYARSILQRIATSTSTEAQNLANKALLNSSAFQETKQESTGTSISRVRAPDFGRDILRKIISRRNINNVVPVIGNSFSIEQIFRGQDELANQIEDLSITEQITRIWAQKIQYPMTDNHNLARVAQYYQVEQDGSPVAKEEYLDFLKRLLLEINANKQGYEDLVNIPKNDVYTMSFSEIATQLDYPQFSDKAEDPLTLLARVPFPIYITTGYHDFLERALRRQAKEPRTQVIFWETGMEYDEALKANHYPDPSFTPTVSNPAVYHLFGLENYPGSLVISEDDYMKFLLSVVSGSDTQKPIVPIRLRRALASSHLLLMGYDYRDWDFRVLFRFISNDRQGDSSKQGIVLQPHLNESGDTERSLDYLKHYFNMEKFEIGWATPESFIVELWNVWKDQEIQ